MACALAAIHLFPKQSEPEVFPRRPYMQGAQPITRTGCLRPVDRRARVLCVTGAALRTATEPAMSARPRHRRRIDINRGS
ncbi:uncharacterized protein L969DRAFT_85565 [Mixia osmundae IAM 14324]|uniref:uncharacterized protein n=1 Tax=Mixia osmundae (strain CBS 9802 / IAM 14324 / JCM 22182 / KY 12970) TaxID=764103 RepID=UPI0004A55351|nr:uncharacterized protein L969DRAFT_85565 [Mixia osmundae IAM 14324]KEI41753.1 hypothetical protein L969DRAFT_85565 [Mixia osmundae IAM 14324]